MEYGNCMVIVADMGQLKAYAIKTLEGINPQNRMQVSSAKSSPAGQNRYRLELLVDKDYIEPHKHTSEQMSDKLGNRSGASGEPHNSRLQQQQSGLKKLAGDIDELLGEYMPENWFLAFPKHLNNQLLERLSRQSREKLDINLPSDLTKTDRSQLLSCFL